MSGTEDEANNSILLAILKMNNEMKEINSNLHNSIEQLSLELKTSALNIDTKICQLESKLDIYDKTLEIQEKECRKRNLIVYGLEETEKKNKKSGRCFT